MKSKLLFNWIVSRLLGYPVSGLIGKQVVKPTGKLANRQTKEGFTMVEILIVLLMLALLVAIAVPNFMAARRDVIKISCIANLKQIDEAIERYAVSFKRCFGDPVEFSDIVPAFLKIKPHCPAQGIYSLTTIDADPVCSKELELGHKLP